MSTEIVKIVESIEDSCPARIKITLKGGHQQSYGCIYKEDEPPHFYLVFPPNTLPENIDTAANHPVSLQQAKKSTSLNSTILEREGDRTIRLRALTTVDPASLREYFRVSTVTPITASHNSWSDSGKNLGWFIEGNTQDMSGSGVLAVFPDEPRTKNNIDLTITLPQKKINISAHLVRKKRLRNKKWLVSFHFNSITVKNRDYILKYLFSIQRKQLRENVSVGNNW